MENFFRQFTRESIGIIEFESDVSRQNDLVLLFETIDLAIQQFHALRKGRRKTLFLDADHTFDVFLLCREFAEIRRAAENLNDGIYCTVKKRIRNTKHTPVPDCTAQCAAQDIPPPFVGRQDTVHDHDGDRPRMICDYLQRNIFALIASVCNARNLRRVSDDRIEEIRLEVRFFILHNGRKPLQSAAGINVLVRKEVVFSLLAAIVLCKDQIPNFKEAVAVAADAAGRLSTAAPFTEIDIDLGVRTTGTGADLPKIIVQRNNMIRQ